MSHTKYKNVVSLDILIIRIESPMMFKCSPDLNLFPYPCVCVLYEAESVPALRVSERETETERHCV